MSGAADRIAQARREFIDAMERGVTIPQLRAERAELRRRARQAVAAPAGPVPVPPAAHDFHQFDAPWMMRN